MLTCDSIKTDLYLQLTYLNILPILTTEDLYLTPINKLQAKLTFL